MPYFAETNLLAFTRGLTFLICSSSILLSSILAIFIFLTAFVNILNLAEMFPEC